MSILRKVYLLKNHPMTGQWVFALKFTVDQTHTCVTWPLTTKIDFNINTDSISKICIYELEWITIWRPCFNNGRKTVVRTIYKIRYWHLCAGELADFLVSWQAEIDSLRTFARICTNASASIFDAMSKQTRSAWLLAPPITALLCVPTFALWLWGIEGFFQPFAWTLGIATVLFWGYPFTLFVLKPLHILLRGSWLFIPAGTFLGFVGVIIISLVFPDTQSRGLYPNDNVAYLLDLHYQLIGGITVSLILSIVFRLIQTHNKNRQGDA